MKNGFKLLSGLTIREDQCSHFAPLQSSVLSDELVAKDLPYGVHRCTVRLSEFMGNGIGIKDFSPQLRKKSRSCCFATRDSPRQAYDERHYPSTPK
jgi:hypothetical protein